MIYETGTPSCHEVGVYEPEHALVCDDEHGLAVALELVDERVQPRDDVQVVGVQVDI